MAGGDVAGVSEQPAEPLSIFPPPWFVTNFNLGVARDWAGEGSPPYRGALDPIVMAMWLMATEDLRRPRPFTLLSGV
jgi:hypothetical protein